MTDRSPLYQPEVGGIARVTWMLEKPDTNDVKANKSKTETRKGFVTLVDSDAMTFDIELEDGDEELCEVSFDRLRVVEDFEKPEATPPKDFKSAIMRAEKLKTLKDYIAASNAFAIAAGLAAPKLSCGSSVVVAPGSVIFDKGAWQDPLLLMRYGTVSDVGVNDETCDVMYEDGDEEDEDGVNSARVIPITLETSALAEAQAMALLDSATCLIRSQAKPNRYDKAVELCGWTLGILAAGDNNTRFGHASSMELRVLNRQFKDATFKTLMLRCRAHLLQEHFIAAASDVKRAVILCPGDESARAMVKAVQSRRALGIKKSKKLAREVTKWVASATATESERPDEEGINDNNMIQDQTATEDDEGTYGEEEPAQNVEEGGSCVCQ